MTFLQPWALWFLAGVPLIVALYFLRLKRRSVPVSTHLFWQRVLGENSRRALFQRLRHLLSLLLHLVIFLLLTAALARPLLNRVIHDAPATVIILDTRARMNALEPDGKTRLQRAIAQARVFARQASPSRQVALLTLDAAPAAVVPFTDDARALLDALDAVQPTDAAGDMSAALNLADSLLAGRGGKGRIIMLSDHAPPGRELIAPGIATERDNLAITRFATRPLPANPATAEMLVEIANFSAEESRTELEVEFDGRVIEVRPLALKPGERRTEIFPSFTRPSVAARGWLVARIRADDALASDNVAYAALPAARPARVLLVSDGSPFLEKLLAVDASVKFQLITPDAWQDSLREKFEVVVFDCAPPAGFDPLAASGNFLLLKPAALASGRQIERPLLTQVDASHPATRGVNLENVSVLRAAALVTSLEGWKTSVPVRSQDDAVFITAERDNRRVAALGFDLLESDLPLRVAFPLLISNTIRWLSGSSSEAVPAVRAGEVLMLAQGQRASVSPVVSAQPVAMPAPDRTGFIQPMRNGFYAVTEAAGTRWLAVNTFSEEESDLRGSQEARPSAPLSMVGGSLPPWQWLALAAFALFSGEWWLFHRRRTE